ncbi:MAG: hypothetical protein JRI93_02665 [Deltaproteobacteria bacterium]|nr:hypothetical protein [Deltaproteobacteria bacterium]
MTCPISSKKPFRDRWQYVKPRVDKPSLTISFFAGCAIDFIYPEQAESMLDLMRVKSVAVKFPQNQTCCGLPALSMCPQQMKMYVAVSAGPTRWTFLKSRPRFSNRVKHTAEVVAEQLKSRKL